MRYFKDDIVEVIGAGTRKGNRCALLPMGCGAPVRNGREVQRNNAA